MELNKSQKKKKKYIPGTKESKKGKGKSKLNKISELQNILTSQLPDMFILTELIRQNMANSLDIPSMSHGTALWFPKTNNLLLLLGEDHTERREVQKANINLQIHTTLLTWFR